MALLFCDSFNHVDDAYAALKWDTKYFGDYISGVGRQGDWGIRFGPSHYTKKTLASNYSTIIFGAAIKTPGNASNELIYFLESGSIQIEIRIDTAGTIKIYRGTSTWLGSSNIGDFSINTWHYFEAKITFNQTVGSVEIKVDGIQVINLTGIDTCSTANEYCNGFQIEGNELYTYFDDLYICDTTGLNNNNFLGDVKITLLYPTSDVENDFTCSTGTDHYALVDDPQLVADTDHNESSTVGHKDTYGVTTFSGTGTVLGVQVCAAVKNTDTGTMKVRTITKSGTVPAETEGSDFTLSQTMKGAMTVHEQEPIDSVAWTATKINAAEFGLKVQS